VLHLDVVVESLLVRMATIDVQGKTKEVNGGSALLEPCQELGIAFGCTQGRCGTCRVTVEEGKENLSPKTDEEIEMGLESNERLACQTRIEGGTVKLRQGW